MLSLLTGVYWDAPAVPLQCQSRREGDLFRTKGTSRQLGEDGVTGEYVRRYVSSQIRRAPTIWDELDRVGGSFLFTRVPLLILPGP